MTSISKNVYIDKLPDIKPKAYVDCLVKFNTKIHKSKVAEHKQISKGKIVFLKNCKQN